MALDNSAPIIRKGKKIMRKDKGESQVATEAIPVSEMTRDQMLEHLAVVEPKSDYSEASDDELRDLVNMTMEQDQNPGSAEEPPADQPAEDEKPEAVEEIRQEDLDKLPTEARRVVETLLTKLQTVQTKGTKRVASGSKARPNVKYTLLKKPPKWHDTPQVAQIEQILFADDVLKKFQNPETKKVEIPEPELFDLIKRGAESGVLRTRQNPVRIFQYYRTDLRAADVIQWQ